MFAKFVGKNKGNMVYIIVNEYGDWRFHTRRALWGPMPCDRWDSGKWCFVHATGNEYYDYNTGSWRVEYEDDLDGQLCNEARVA